ncbi:MAG: hypothetical protein LBP73_00245 [Clostridiales Family XIII bacterium]|jgi:hypothetical protein|nr:hypothetical protein [Clostridiales Family XIII bacterium]
MKKKPCVAILSLCAILTVCGCDARAESEPKTAESAPPAGETTFGDTSSGSPAEPAPAVGGTILLSFERISENATDAQGNILARMYIDKPVLSLEPFDSQDGTSAAMNALTGKRDDNPVISRINAYFEEDVKGFFYGSEKSKHFAQGWYDYFFECVERKREASGDEVLANSPFFCTVDSEVAYMTDEMLSIKQSFDWMAGGVRNLNYYGSTFDLRTGELLTLDRFVNDGREDFEAKIFAKLRERFSIGEEEIHDYEYFLAQLREKNIGEHEFYYDGQNIHIIFDGIFPGMGFVLRYTD